MTNIGAKARAEIKTIWEDGIKPHPEIRSMGLELITIIKRKAMGLPDATDEKLTRVRKAYNAVLSAVKEENGHGSNR